MLMHAYIGGSVIGIVTAEVTGKQFDRDQVAQTA
jgi:hypothetical protein